MAPKVKAPAPAPSAGSRSLAQFATRLHGDKSRFRNKIGNRMPGIIVPTGSVAIDWMLRIGGVETGRLYEVMGPEDAGKSTLAISILIQHLLMFPDRGVGYVNLEKTFDEKRATAMGLDCSDAAIASARWNPMLADHAEDAADMARELIDSGVMSCVVIDSVGAMESRKVLEKDAEKAAETVTPNSKLITQMTKALAWKAGQHGTTVILVNQPRAVISSMGLPDQSAGPKALRHATTVKITMRPGGGEGETRQLRLPGETALLVASIMVHARAPRMKNGLPGRVASPFLNRVGTAVFGPPGFDEADSYLTLGCRQDQKIIKVGGAWYTFPGGHRENGKDAAMRYLRETPDAIRAIREQIVWERPTDVLPDLDETDTAGAEDGA